MDKLTRALRRMACRRCGNVSGITTVDGKDCGGMPGFSYRVCGNCGHALLRRHPSTRIFGTPEKRRGAGGCEEIKKVGSKVGSKSARMRSTSPIWEPLLPFLSC